ncbi:hypothetical protein [Candidatus Protochlamydia amoebophila]|uniref:Cyclodipeptide synthase n=1 Tax=Protochlamydia amoebophila (strain UWE25) TaxID=264201 RepID=A0A2P9HAC5_PARUW|nr:hypothetical protein [Candidatus Protochlamydia amoebophila]SPJ31949.1 unnamed protein product [Candidatus Protochlamydia amoebophila UWE25]
MNKYTWRKNFTAILSNQKEIIKGKLAFKTEETHWLETEKPVIILVSTHSSFHEKISGDLKMNAFVSTIRNHVKGKITVLLSDRAHINTMSLRFQNDLQKAQEECLIKAHALRNRYQSYFENCNVVYGHSYISQNKNFASFLKVIESLAENDSTFHELLLKDAESAYSNTFIHLFPDKNLFIKNTREDILTQCASSLVLIDKGYRYQFYPGSSYESLDYLNRIFISQEKQLSWIRVFLTIEKKTILHNIMQN